MKKLKLGLLGCGKMAINHSQSFHLIKDKVEVTCVCDIDKEKADSMAERIGCPIAVYDCKDMFEHCDAILAVLPHSEHYKMGKLILENKKHLLMEKPLCNTEKECYELGKLAEKNNVKLMVAYCVRFMEPVLQMKRMVEEGLIGDVFHMSIWTEQHTKNFLPPETQVRDLGGGQLFSHGCHYIDILLWFLGNPVKGFHLGTNKCTPWMVREGTSDVAILFENGALGYHMGTWGAVGTRHGWEFQIHGSKGMLAYSKIGEFGGKVVFYHNLGAAKIHNEDANDTDYEIMWKTDDMFGKKTGPEILHFADCVLNDKQPLTTAFDSIQGIKIIHKLYEAEENGVVADLRGLGLGQFDESEFAE